MNGKQIAVLLTIISTAAILLNYESATKISEFESWKATHAISFASEFENTYREKIFL